MIHLKTYQQALITEGSTDILYHFTELENALAIIKSNTFKLSSPVGLEDKLNNKEYPYYFSMTTSASSGVGYAKIALGSYQARFCLDARQLQHQYKIHRVDYYGIGGDMPRPRAGVEQDELEERLLSHKALITPALRYVLRIDLLIPPPQKKMNTMRPLSDIAWEIVSLSDVVGVPIRLYDERRYFDRSAEQYAINS